MHDRRVSWLVLLLAVFALLACSPATAPSGSMPPGTLVITQAGSDDGGLYIEGALAYVEIVTEGGAVATELEDIDYLGSKELGRMQLPAGRYTIRTYVRGCSGNCGELDPPSDVCEVAVEVPAAALTEVHITRQVGQPCEAKIRGQ